MFSFLLLVAISQPQHDNTERAIYSELQQYREQISDIWHPSKRLVNDYQAASNCYTKFHLGKGDSCRKQLDQLKADLQHEAK